MSNFSFSHNVYISMSEFNFQCSRFSLDFLKADGFKMVMLDKLSMLFHIKMHGDTTAPGGILNHFGKRS